MEIEENKRPGESKRERDKAGRKARKESFEQAVDLDGSILPQRDVRISMNKADQEFMVNEVNDFIKDSDLDPN